MRHICVPMTCLFLLFFLSLFCFVSLIVQVFCPCMHRLQLSPAMTRQLKSRNSNALPFTGGCNHSLFECLVRVQSVRLHPCPCSLISSPSLASPHNFLRLNETASMSIHPLSSSTWLSCLRSNATLHFVDTKEISRNNGQQQQKHPSSSMPKYCNMPRF